MCQDVIHYPSEDYPCLCIGFENGATQGKCRNCEHERESHAWARVCRPDAKDYCACSRVEKRL